MANKTTNYNLTKPLVTENYDVGVQNGNMDLIDEALAPTATGDTVPAAPAVNSSAKLPTWLSWILNRIKAITGKANWYDAPTKSIEDLNTDVETHKADNVTFEANTNNHIGTVEKHRKTVYSTAGPTGTDWDIWIKYKA